MTAPKKKPDPAPTIDPSTTSAEESARVKAAFAAHPVDEPVRRGPGRPPKQRTPAAGTAAPLDQQDVEFWGRTVQGFWNGLAELRAYPKMSEQRAQGIANTAALTANKYLPNTAVQRPWVGLLMEFAPYLSAAVKVEYARIQDYLQRRRNGQKPGGRGPIRIPSLAPLPEQPAEPTTPPADVGTPRDAGGDGLGQDNPGEGFDTAPFPGFSR